MYPVYFIPSKGTLYIMCRYEFSKGWTLGSVTLVDNLKNLKGHVLLCITV